MLGQRPGEVLAIQIFAGVNGVAGIADGLDDELRLDPLRPLGKKQHPGQVQQTVIRGQVHVLQQRQTLAGGVRILQMIHIAQKIAEAQLVEPVDPRLGRQLVGVKLIDALEEAAQLFFGVHPPLVGAALEPDDAVLVEVGLVHSLGHGQHDDEPSVVQFQVFRLHRERTAHVL